MIISVSDVHLGEDGYQEQDKQFSKWLDFVEKDALKNGGHLVLLGDIFDFWRKDTVQVVQEYSDLIEKLFEFPNNVEIHYIFGNHDFYISEVPEYFKASPFKSFGSTIDIKDEGQTFRFIHGYQLEVIANPYTKDMQLYESLARRLSYHSGLTGKVASGIWNAICSLTKEEGDYANSIIKDPSSRLSGKSNAGDNISMLAKSKGRRLLLGGPFDWLVFGHTHNPFIDTDSKTINTGSWGRNHSRDKMYYLKIANGMPELMEWKKV
jgi:UDP-2,3-diacylglucosamine pyrophosphatase LpxH